MLYYWHNTLNQQLEPCSGFSAWYRFFCGSIFPCNLNSFYPSSPFHSSPSVTFSLFLPPFQKSILNCRLFVCFCLPVNSICHVCLLPTCLLCVLKCIRDVSQSARKYVWMSEASGTAFKAPAESFPCSYPRWWLGEQWRVTGLHHSVHTHTDTIPHCRAFLTSCTLA